MQATTNQIEDFHEFMRREGHTPNERLLIQAIASLSVLEPNRSKTPEEIWDEQRELAYQVWAEEGA